MRSIAKTPVLVLNQSFEPIQFASARRAIVLIVKGRAAVVEEHDDYVHIGIRMPCVIRLREYRRIPHRSLECGRKNILIRDGYTCQYCGKKFSGHDLTLDHVMPESRGGIKTWENLVAACGPCNRRKSNRTPEEAGMPLLRRPRRMTIHTARNMMRLIGSDEKKWRRYLYFGE
jgi:5-methylcytosine-specific restriction endonuclease McrA